MVPVSLEYWLSPNRRSTPPATRLRLPLLLLSLRLKGQNKGQHFLQPQAIPEYQATVGKIPRSGLTSLLRTQKQRNRLHCDSESLLAPWSSVLWDLAFHITAPWRRMQQRGDGDTAKAFGIIGPLLTVPQAEAEQERDGKTRSRLDRGNSWGQ